MSRSIRMVWALIVIAATTGSLSLHGQSSAISSPGISNGYIAPTSKVGINDTAYDDFPQYRADRWARFNSIGSKFQAYPTGWSGFEAEPGSPFYVPSSADPNLACPNGFSRVPENEAERIAKGYHKFRCFSAFQISKYDAIFSQDQQRGVEIVAGAYSTPRQYQYVQCRPPLWQGQPFDDGCVPRDDAMDDYEDYVNFLLSRWNGVNGVGKITHFLVWNEFQSGLWFNYDPIVPWDQVPSPQAINLLAEKYKQLLVRAHTAIARHLNPWRPAALLYISLDAPVSASFDGGVYHIDTIAGLTALWTTLGTTIDWSISIHPYGNPTADLGLYLNYAKLQPLVEWQMQRLLDRGISSPLNRPQTILLANEQGWTSPGEVDHATRAVYVCQAHDLSMKLPPLIGSTHNSFQVTQDCATGAVYPDPFGLIPASAGCNLSQIDSPPSPEWLAYQSMAPANWGKNNSHGCCTALGLGCVAALAGAVEGVVFEGGEWVLKGWSCSPGADQSIIVHLYGNGPAGVGTIMGGFNANLASEPTVNFACRSAGKNFRFRIPLTDWLQYHGVPLYVHGISPYGAPNDLLPGSGAYRIP